MLNVQVYYITITIQKYTLDRLFLSINMILKLLSMRKWGGVPQIFIVKTFSDMALGGDGYQFLVSNS